MRLMEYVHSVYRSKVIGLHLKVNVAEVKWIQQFIGC